MRRATRRLTYANVMSTIAVFVALGGASYAIVSIPKNSIGAKQVKNHSLGLSELTPAAIRSLRGTAGPRGATGPVGPPGTNGTNGTNGTKGDTGPAGPNWVTSVVAQQENITTGAALPLGDPTLPDGPSVTVTVPSSGLVELYARVHIENDANGNGTVGLFLDGALSQQACGTLGHLLDTLTNATPGDYATAANTCGVRVDPAAILKSTPLVIATTPGTHTFKLVYGINHTGGADTTIKFGDRRLAVLPMG